MSAEDLDVHGTALPSGRYLELLQEALGDHGPLLDRVLDARRCGRRRLAITANQMETLLRLHAHTVMEASGRQTEFLAAWNDHTDRLLASLRRGDR